MTYWGDTGESGHFWWSLRCLHYIGFNDIYLLILSILYTTFIAGSISDHTCHMHITWPHTAYTLCKMHVSSLTPITSVYCNLYNFLAQMTCMSEKVHAHMHLTHRDTCTILPLQVVDETSIGLYDYVVGKQPTLPGDMGTWPKLADRPVWAHGNTWEEKKRKRALPTGIEPGGLCMGVERDARCTAVPTPEHPFVFFILFLAFQRLVGYTPFCFVSPAYCHVPILVSLPTLAMCPAIPAGRVNLCQFI